MPPTGYLLLEQEDYIRLRFRVIEDIQFGLPGVLAAWPYVLFGVILGLTIGYVLGELARRKLAIEVASEEAVNRASHIMAEANNLNNQAESKLLQAERQKEDTLQMFKRLMKELEECRSVRANADEQIRIYEEKLGEAEKNRRELLRAKETIRKLVEKISRLKKEKTEEECQAGKEEKELTLDAS
ncbi:MAG: hypothetical protein U1D97_14945 [Desulfuromonadales bacterium]|nr:hypothetical protein [Desulfuromonadales bacterium]